MQNKTTKTFEINFKEGEQFDVVLISGKSRRIFSRCFLSSFQIEAESQMDLMKLHLEIAFDRQGFEETT